MTRTPLRIATAATLVAASLLLSACGGGGASGNQPDLPPLMTVVLSDVQTRAARTSIAVGSPAMVTATLLDGKRKPVANTVVTFTIAPSDQVAITPVQGSALTDAAGTATVQIEPTTLASAGAATITATAQLPASTSSSSTGSGGTTTGTGTATATSVTGSVSFAIVSPGGTGATAVTVTLVDPRTAVTRTSIALGNPAKVVAAVVDARGRPVANSVVTFTPSPIWQVVMTPAVGSALTDSRGIASVSVEPTTLASAGAATITATVQQGTASASGLVSFAITGGSGGATGLPSIVLTLTDPDKPTLARTSITVGSPATVTAKLLDAKGVAIPNTVVTFSVAPAGQVLITPAIASDLTKADGSATVRVDPVSISSSGAATITATAQVGTLSVTQGVSFKIFLANPSFQISHTHKQGLTLLLRRQPLQHSSGDFVFSVSSGIPRGHFLPIFRAQ